MHRHLVSALFFTRTEALLDKLANPNVSSAPVAMSNPETVQLVGSKFRLGRKLGGGSFGEIYLGVCCFEVESEDVKSVLR